MTASRELIEWEYLRDNYLLPGVPIEDPILEDPEFRLVFHPNPKQFGVRLRLDAGEELPQVSQLRNITVSKVQIDDKAYVQVLTGSEELFRAIHALIGETLYRIKEGEKDCLHALGLSLASFEALVAKATGISREAALGLYGELWVLESLARSGKADAKAWIGPLREPHDLRIGAMELEVKTTGANARHHVIHGLNQLNPSPGHDLSLVSIRLGSPGSGAGRSLDRIVADLHDLFSARSEDAKQFRDTLKESQYERGQYECTVAYQLAAPPMEISVGSDFPIVDPGRLSEVLGKDAAGRVLDMRLVVNLEGLGVQFTPENLGSGRK